MLVSAGELALSRLKIALPIIGITSHLCCGSCGRKTLHVRGYGLASPMSVLAVTH